NPSGSEGARNRSERLKNDQAGATFQVRRLAVSSALFGDGLSLNGARFRASWRPVLGREGNPPKLLARGQKFESDFRVFAADRAEKHHVALLLFLRALVGQFKDAAAGNARMQKNQRAMRVEGQGVGVLTEIPALRIMAGNLNPDLHEDALAAAANSGMGRVLRWLGHEGLSGCFHFTI